MGRRSSGGGSWKADPHPTWGCPEMVSLHHLNHQPSFFKSASMECVPEGGWMIIVTRVGPSSHQLNRSRYQNQARGQVRPQDAIAVASRHGGPPFSLVAPLDSTRSRTCMPPPQAARPPESLARLFLFHSLLFSFLCLYPPCTLRYSLPSELSLRKEHPHSAGRSRRWTREGDSMAMRLRAALETPQEYP